MRLLLTGLTPITPDDPQKSIGFSGPNCRATAANSKLPNPFQSASESNLKPNLSSVYLFVFVCFENFWQLSWRFAAPISQSFRRPEPLTGACAANPGDTCRPVRFQVLVTQGHSVRSQESGVKSQKSKVSFLRRTLFVIFLQIAQIMRGLCIDCAQL